MNIVKLAASLPCVALAFGINLLARPQFDPHYDPAEYGQTGGTLALARRGNALEHPLMPTHIVTADVERFGRSYEVRELLLRSPGSGDPQLQLFANLHDRAGDLLHGAHDPSVLLQVELPLAKSGRLGAQQSYIVLDGRRSDIVTGNLLITDITLTTGGASPRYHAEGRLEMQVQTASGIDMFTGKWTGALVWDAALTGAGG